METGNEISRRTFFEQASKAGAAGAIAAAIPVSATAEGSKKAPWQIGCYTRPWAKYEYTVALDAIAEAGFKYVGLMTTKSKNGLVLSVETSLDEARRVGEECKKRGLKVPSVYGGDIPVAESLEAGVTGLKKLIDNCEAAGVANLMMGGIGDERLYEVYYKAIAQCCDYAAGKGIGMSVKPHGGLNATGPQCRKTIEFVNNKNFKIWYDPGNIFYYSDGKLDPIDDDATVDGLVIGMSVKDFQMPKVVDLTPGTGQVNFPKVMARLIKGGFTSGPLIIECLSPGDLPHLATEAKKAREFVEELVGKLPKSVV